MTQTAFTLTESRRIPTLNIEIQAYVHAATGARHYHLACDDDNNAFMVAFPTIPRDSTGVAHILEHTTLCGSQRYPVRDPFFMMLRRSLNTFMNAFTSSDSTAYPFATRNRRDFDNLLGIYLDAVFFPILDPLDFAQEGCRIEFAANAESTPSLVYKGVVYNEMKGAMSSPVAQLWQHVQASLLPDTAYRFNSGGDPAVIPRLTHAQLREFHAVHYHPTQAAFITYGCFSPQDHQQRFEALALSRFSHADQIIVSSPQPPLTTARSIDATYAVDQEDDLSDGTHLVWAWLLGDTVTPRNLLEAHLLTGVLLEHSASPLRHFLETTSYAKAPSELCGLDDSARQLAFLCGVEGSEAAHAAALEGDILAVLARVADDGVEPAALHAALDRIEMAQRDISGDSYPYGLQLMSRLLPGAMYRADPMALLDIDALLASLRDEIADPEYFKGLLRTRLLDNPHRVRVSMVPDLHKRQAEQDDERRRLDTLLTKLSTSETTMVTAQAAALLARQDRRDDPNILPKITLADVPASVAPVIGTIETLSGRSLQAYQRGTNGLVHAQLVFDLPALTHEELSALPLFANYLLEFGAGKESYLQTQARRAQVGHFGATLSVRSQLADLRHHHAHFVVSAKGLRRHTSKLVSVLEEILSGARFDEAPRLIDLLAQTRADLEQGITDRGHQLAMHSAARGLSPSGWLSDLWDGPSNVREIQRLDTAVNATPSALAGMFTVFESLRRKLLKHTPRVLIVGEDDALALARAELATTASVVAQEGPRFEVPPAPVAQATAWLANAEVNFCAKAYPVISEGHPDAPALAVLSRYLSDGFLHPAIREKGGAYGGGASFDGDSGCFFFYSYRDPRLADTLADFDRALEWFAATNEPMRLEESILGVIRGLDKPRSPAGAAIDAFYSQLQSRTPAFRAQIRHKVLNMSYAELSAVATRYLDPRRAVIGVVTNRAEEATIASLGLVVEQL
ncbi:MAG: peptidase M16 [Gammaproteobacteria bacterium]|nr:peptidase M16 [Gammaproteobacteria bacterium]